MVNRFLSLLILGLFVLLLTGCGGGEGGGEAGSIASGESASLTWDPVPHHTAVFYTVHYGKQSSAQAGSCNYETSLDVSEPAATITGLEPGTLYYFAVSAHDGDLRSLCSDEVSKETPAKHHQKPCEHGSDIHKCNSA